MSDIDKIQRGADRSNIKNPANPMPQKPPTRPRMAAILEEQTRQKIRRKRQARDFAMARNVSMKANSVRAGKSIDIKPTG